MFTGGLTRAAGENVGTYAISQGTLSAGSNYNILFTGANFSITPRDLTVTADVKTKTYCTSDPALTYTHGPLYNGDTNSVFTGGLTRAAGENVGTYAISQGTLSAGSNYNILFTGANFTITKAHLTVKADDKSKVYDGNPFTAFTVTITGFVCGDTVAVVSGSASYTTNPTGATLPGTYTITPAQGTLSATNYDFTTFNTGTLNITFGTCTGFDPGSVILPPINADGTSVYSKKTGKTIPVKFKVCDAAGNSISDPNVVFPTGQTCGGVTLTGVRRGTVDNVNENADTDIPGVCFTYSGDHWQFNLATTNLTAGDTDTFQIALKDGSFITFTVGLK